jgi:hypothetical protein
MWQEFPTSCTSTKTCCSAHRAETSCVHCLLKDICMPDWSEEPCFYTHCGPATCVRVVYQDFCNTSSTTKTSLHTQEFCVRLDVWCWHIFQDSKIWITSLVLRAIWKCEVYPSHFCTEATFCIHIFKYLYLRAGPHYSRASDVHHHRAGASSSDKSLYLIHHCVFLCLFTLSLLSSKAEGASLLGCDAVSLGQ